MNGNPSLWKNSRILRCIGALPEAANLHRPRPILALAYRKHYTEYHNCKDNKTIFIIKTQNFDQMAVYKADLLQSHDNSMVYLAHVPCPGLLLASPQEEI